MSFVLQGLYLPSKNHHLILVEGFVCSEEPSHDNLTPLRLDSVSPQPW